jgi:hypothetical protein
MRLFRIESTPEFDNVMREFDPKEQWTIDVIESMAARDVMPTSWYERYLDNPPERREPDLIVTLSRNAARMLAAETIMKNQITAAGVDLSSFLGFVSRRSLSSFRTISQEMDLNFSVPDSSMKNNRRVIPCPSMKILYGCDRHLQFCRWLSLYGYDWQKAICASGLCPVYIGSSTTKGPCGWALECDTENWDGYDMSEFDAANGVKMQLER